MFEYKDSLSEVARIGIQEIKQGIDKNVLYTFCVPTFKRTKDLKETLDSIFAQETDIEYNVIVSDNNPERHDETEKLIFSTYTDKPNLRYIKNNENLGMAGNWNRLVLECKSQYMILIHDDDVLYPFYLDRVDKIRTENANLSALNVGRLMWNGSPIHPHYKGKGKLRVLSALSNFPKFQFGATSGCLLTVKDINEIGGFDPECYPSIDYVAIEKLCLQKKMVLTTSEELMAYRVGTNTTAKLETQLKWLDIDYQIKTELKKLLAVPTITFKIVLWFEIKMRLRMINKLEKGTTYKDYRPGGRLFCLLHSIYCEIIKRFI